MAEAGSAAGSHRLGQYLQRLRGGFGHSLRRVEQRARSLGEAIDNSQLSRFEKGKALPSFDKLRVLGRIFNVPLQALADRLELDVYDALVPELEDYQELMDAGERHDSLGEPGAACVAFERAVDRADSLERRARATLRLSAALTSLGLTEWSERELRGLLREQGLDPAVRRQVVLQLGRLCRDAGDHDLAVVLVRDCLERARDESDSTGQAVALAALGDLQLDAGDAARALASYDAALAGSTPAADESAAGLRLSINRGACLIALGRHGEALDVLGTNHCAALRRGDRTSAALALTRIAEALRGSGDVVQARTALQEADRLASSGSERAEEVLFLIAYQRWAIARHEGHAAREKWALDRLRALRPGVRRCRREAGAYDRFVRDAG